jgi:hypothetical protein
MIRDTGLEFDQEMTITFEYELRSIDGINPRIAMIDLLSNVLLCTMNKGTFWGGETRFYGGNSRKVKPFGNPDKLKSGDYDGWISSVFKGLSDNISGMMGGKGFFEGGASNLLKAAGGNLLSQVAGAGLDKMGRRAPQVINSLLSGESTGEWHLTIGNPANPIISIGNLALTSTDIQLYGPLSNDDFPTQLKVICSLKPARPRERIDIISMFSRNNRTYLTVQPETVTYTDKKRPGKLETPKKSAGSSRSKTKGKKNKSKKPAHKDSDFIVTSDPKIKDRFPNHIGKNAVILQSAKWIG